MVEWLTTAKTRGRPVAGSTPDRGVGVTPPASVIDFVRRVRARGGELRVTGSLVQYRPAGALTSAEREWLRAHRSAVAMVLVAPDPDDAVAFQRWLRLWVGRDYVHLGHAGPGVSAWAPRSPGRRCTGPSKAPSGAGG